MYGYPSCTHPHLQGYIIKSRGTGKEAIRDITIWENNDFQKYLTPFFIDQLVKNRNWSKFDGLTKIFDELLF